MAHVRRDLAAERRLLDLAAAAAGFPSTGASRHAVPVSLERAGVARALLGPNGEPSDQIWLPPGRDLIEEGADELIDAGAHYFLWEAVRCEPGLFAGDPVATARYDRAMRALVRVVQGWGELGR